MPVTSQRCDRRVGWEGGQVSLATRLPLATRAFALPTPHGGLALLLFPCIVDLAQGHGNGL